MISVTVDIVVVSHDRVLLVQRKNKPFQGQWALPGGFLNEGEAPLYAALRELKEETGLLIPTTEMIFQIGAFGKPNRDPRGHVVSVAYYVQLSQNCPEVVGADDAAIAMWWPYDNAMEKPLAFDHVDILRHAVRRIQNSIECDPVI